MASQCRGVDNLLRVTDAV